MRNDDNRNTGLMIISVFSSFFFNYLFLFKDLDLNELELESRTSTALPPQSAHDFDPEFEAKTWKSTVLGKAYQEGRLNKRERKQPGSE